VAKKPARPKPAVSAAQAALQDTDLAIERAKRWMGFAVQVAAGIGSVGAGIYEYAHPGVTLVPFIPDWQLIVLRDPAVCQRCQ
jgi:hypothetical protein